jgi:hemerythrin
MNPDHHVGHEEIDAQHDHIIELVDALTRAHSGVAKDTSDVLLEHLARYLRWHFRTEEDAMEEAHFPELEQHREEHRACIARMDEFAAGLKETGFLDLSTVASYLTEWMKLHTFNSDQKAASYFGQVRIRTVRTSGGS